MIPPTRLDRRGARGASSRDARNPEERRGDLRAQLAAHRLAERRLDELCARRGRERVAAAMDELYAYSERMVRAAIARLPDGRCEAEDVLEAVDGELVDPRRRRDRRRRDPDRLRRNRAAARREPQLPARGDALGLLLRRPLPDRPRSACVRRRVRARHRDGARGLPRQRAPARGRRRREHRDLVADRRRPLRARSARGRRSRAGSGDDEQRRARQRPLHVLRDDRRRPGRVPGRRRAVAASTSRCRTRSSRRSRRSSSRTRCASSATALRRGLRRRGRARAAATASSASCACSRTAGSRCSPSAARAGRAACGAAPTAHRAATS